jgi:molybdopterin-guanine dinucleotide biosynthesis protein A
MGRDKATLTLASGERLVDRVGAALREALGGGRVVVSGRVDGCDCVPDLVPGLGPLGGLRSALRAAGAAPEPPGWLLAVPVDLPAISAAALAPLLAAAERHPGAAAIAWRDHELPALLRASAALGAELARRCDGPDRERSVWRLLAALGGPRLDPDPAVEAALANANTPAELRAADPTGGRP